ncbi:uncharacterized protein [Ptychodera flava]|uniref:uncharacterized protein n=1 Tax=Ptychodera flava TaxID=63121 RepID=UPI003969EA03
MTQQPPGLSVEMRTLQSMVQGQVLDAVGKSSEKLLSDLEKLMTSRLQGLKKDIEASQRDFSQSQLSAIKELKYTETPVFKRKGCEVQFKFNQKLSDHLAEAHTQLTSVPTPSQEVAAAKEHIVKGMTLLSHRQKLVRMADKSDLGWALVEEYETHELAEGSDDEKRIFKAEARAAKKRREQQAKRRNKVFNNVRWSPYSTDKGVVASASAAAATGSGNQRKPGACFACGKFGHWRNECLALQNARSQPSATAVEKISKFSDSGYYDSSSRSSLSDDLILGQEDDTLDVGVGGNVGVTSFMNENSYLTVSNTVVDNGTADTESLFEMQFETAVDDDASHGVEVRPAGRLAKAFDSWKSAGTNSYVLDVIKNGYRLPFKEQPAGIILENNKSARDNAVFVANEIDKLLLRGSISQVSVPPFVVNPLTVAVNSAGKPRLVLDCRHINLCLFKFKFRCEDVSLVRQVFSRGDFLFSFDLKSAYHHIEIFEPHRTFLGFAWPFDGVLKFFVFNVLPFGLSTAPYIFTKVTRALLAFWRNKGLKVFMFIDDGIGGASDFTAALQASDSVRCDFDRFGFLPANEKCCWQPQLVLVWLGHVLDLRKGCVSVTDDRVDNLIRSIQSLLQMIGTGNVLIKARRLASVVGKIISMQGGIGPLVRLRTRCLYSCLEMRASWDSLVRVDVSALRELNFWLHNVKELNGSPLTCNVPTCTVYTDASAVGFGGYIDGECGTEMSGYWSTHESKKSSTWRELEAVYRVIQSFKGDLKGTTVKLLTDNQNVVRILRAGSRVAELQDIAI